MPRIFSLQGLMALSALAVYASGAPYRRPSQHLPSYASAHGFDSDGLLDAHVTGATRGGYTLFPRPPTHGVPQNSSLATGSGTTPGVAPATGQPTPASSANASNPLHLSLVNNLNSDKAHAYVSALDGEGKVVMLTANGTFYYPAAPGNATPQAISENIAIPLPAKGQSMQITIPGYVEGARIWFADGRLDFAVVSTDDGPALVEPTAINPDDASADTNWGFVELTWIHGYGLFANLSFVDFVGMALGMQLATKSSGTQEVKGIPASAVQDVCDKLKQHKGVDQKSWVDLCVRGSNSEVLRVISPSALMSQNPDAFGKFFSRHVDQVWEKYASTPLTIFTQSGAGNVSCTTTGETLRCEGDNRSYAKPTASDIFGCNTGPFAIQPTDNKVHKAVVPRLCAAFHRGTLLLKGGNVQPNLMPSQYYGGKPSNWYSAFVHEVELDGRGYAFAYDDVAPSVHEEVSGAVAAADPRLLTVFVGGKAEQ